VDVNELGTELRVLRMNANASGTLWPGFDPHRTCTAAFRQIESVVADNYSRPFHRERDQSSSEQSWRAEFIDDLEHKSRCIGAVAEDGCIVCPQQQLVCGSIGGAGLNPNELAL
jgi:hypothetical protein